MKRLPLLFALIWAFSSVWFWFLSHELLLFPETALSEGENCIFNADVDLRYRNLSLKPGLSPGDDGDSRHPGAKYLWSAFGVPLRWAFESAYPPKVAQIQAALLVMAFLGGLGATALVFAAVRLGTPWWLCCLALPVYWGFTSQTVAAVPEYFGISACLLSLAFALYCSQMRPSLKLLGLVGVALLALLTTLTMVLFPLLCMVELYLDHVGFDPWNWLWRRKKRVCIVGLACATLALLVFAGFFVRFRQGGGWKAFGLQDSPFTYFNPGRVKQPTRAVTYLSLASVYPAVAPAPQVVLRHAYFTSDNRNLMLTYDPWSFTDYGLWNGLGAAVWVLLFGWCGWKVCQDPRCRNPGVLLFGWIAFNTLFHLLWGDEFFLYSVHWAWALFMVVLMGIRSVRLPLLLLAIPAICAGQAYTLAQVLEGVHEIFASMTPGG